jgi:hypothetical protein
MVAPDDSNEIKNLIRGKSAEAGRALHALTQEAVLTFDKAGQKIIWRLASKPIPGEPVPDRQSGTSTPVPRL